MHNRYRRDSNHALIKAHLQSIPALELRDTSQYGGLGCDLIVLYRGVIYLVEIKSDARNWQMTDSEMELFQMCERTGAPHIIAETSEEILRAMGAI